MFITSVTLLVSKVLLRLRVTCAPTVGRALSQSDLRFPGDLTRNRFLSEGLTYRLKTASLAVCRQQPVGFTSGPPPPQQCPV